MEIPAVGDNHSQNAEATAPNANKSSRPAFRVYVRVHKSNDYGNQHQSIVQPHLDGESITLVSPKTWTTQQTDQEDHEIVGNDATNRIVNNSMSSFDNPMDGIYQASSTCTPGGSRRQSQASTMIAHTEDRNSINTRCRGNVPSQVDMTPQSQSGSEPSPLRTPASFHSKEFAFEKVFHGASTQDDVYAHFRRTAERILTGQDSCVLSFGPKNSGKTHTMFGPSVANGKQDNYWNAAFDVASVYGNPSLLGVVQKSFASIFARLAERKQEKYRVVLSVKELYNDKLQSLIPEDTNDTEMQAKGVQPTNSACATEVNSLQQCFKLLRGSLAKRAVRFHGSRCMSRSHVIVTLQVEQLGAGSGKTGKLTMVDLAGYGEEDKELFTDPVAQLEEKSINLSNNSLTNAVTTLTDHKGEAWMMGQHRNKLTRLLKDCLGSKRCRTTLLAHVDDSLATFHDTASTLFFASKAAEVHGSVSSGYPLTPESVSKLEAKTRTVTSLQNAVDYKSLELEQAQRAHAEAAAQRDALRTDLAQLTNHNQSGSPVSSGSHSSLKDIKIQTTPSLSKAIKEGDIDSAYKEAKKQMEIKLKDFSHQQGSDSNLEKLKQEWSQQLGILRQQLQEEIQRVKEDSAEQVAKQLDYSLKESNTDLNNDRNALEKQLQEAQREVLRQERKVEEMKASLYERQTELEEQLQQSNELREKEVALAHLEQTEAWCDVIDTRLKQREERMNALIEQYEADLKLQDADHLDYQRSALQSQCHQLDHFARRIVEHASTVVEENDRLRDEYENTVNGLRAATSEEIQRIRQEEQWKAQQELQKAVAVAAQQAQWNGFEKSMDIVQRSTDNAIGLLRTKGTWHEECHKHPHQTSSDRVHQEKYVRSARGNASSGNSFQERGLSYRKNDLGSSAKNGDNKKSHHKHSRNIPLPPVYDGAVSDSEGDTSAKDLRKHEKSGQRRPLQRDVDKSVETDSSFIPENGRDEDTDISSSLITDNDSGFEDINKYNSARNQEVASRNPNPNPNRKRKRENGVRNTSGSRVDQRRKKVKSSESDASLEGAWARGIVNQQTQKPTGILKKKIESSSSAGNQKERPVEHSNATISTKGSKSSKKSQGRTLQSAFGRSKESPAAEQKHTSSIPEVSFEGKSSATEQDDELFEDWENTKRNVSKKNSISATNNKNKTHHQQQKSKSKQTSAAAPVNDSVSVDSGKNHQTNESNNDTEERGGSIFSANDIKEMQQTSQQKKSKKLAGRRTALLDLENSIESRQSPRALLQNRLKHTEKVPAADKENSRDSSFSSSVKTGGASTSVASIGMTTGLAMGMHSFGPHGGFKVPKLKKSSTAGLKKSEASSSSSSSGSRRL